MKLKEIRSLLSGGKAKSLIIAAGLLGLVLIFLSTLGSRSGSDSPTSFSVEDYRTRTQQSLCEMLSRIEGVGSVDVLLTIENSVEGVYLDNNSTKTKEIEPVIRGVVVACDGGDDPVAAERAYDAVTKALNISSSKVCITKLQE